MKNDKNVKLIVSTKGYLHIANTKYGTILNLPITEFSKQKDGSTKIKLTLHKDDHEVTHELKEKLEELRLEHINHKIENPEPVT